MRIMLLSTVLKREFISQSLRNLANLRQGAVAATDYSELRVVLGEIFVGKN